MNLVVVRRARRRGIRGRGRAARRGHGRAGSRRGQGRGHARRDLGQDLIRHRGEF